MESLAATPDILDPDRRPSDIERINPQQTGRAALRAFFAISRLWGLSASQEQVLLGQPPRSTFYMWKKRQTAVLSRDTLERISYILGIYKALHILLPHDEAADSWIWRENAAAPFNGARALDYMLRGNVSDLADVRRYLDAERG